MKCKLNFCLNVLDNEMDIRKAVDSTNCHFKRKYLEYSNSFLNLAKMCRFSVSSALKICSDSWSCLCWCFRVDTNVQVLFNSSVIFKSLSSCLLTLVRETEKKINWDEFDPDLACIWKLEDYSYIFKANVSYTLCINVHW